MSAYSALAQFYDSLTVDVPYDDFIAFYEQIFKSCGLNVHTILDLACGTGTLSCRMARRGYELICVDGSPDMLAVAAEKTGGLTPRPLLLCQEMDALDLYGTVDAAVCSLDGINYVAPETLGEVFRRVWLFLEPGGVFIFDVNSVFKLQGLDGEMYIDETDDVFCVWRTEFDDAEQCCYYGMDIFARDGETWNRSREEHVEFAYSGEFLQQTLMRCGFVDVQVYGDRTFSPPEAEEMRIFISARKPKM